MGISTVSGPFRSQNGFQELVNGVWTPVGGGGKSLIVAPGTTDLVFTEVGQIITVTAFNPDSTPGNYVFNLIAPSGLPTSFYSIVYAESNSLPFPNHFLSGNGSPTFGSGPLQLTFVYQGDAVSGFYGPTSYFSCTGHAAQAA